MLSDTRVAPRPRRIRRLHDGCAQRIVLRHSKPKPRSQSWRPAAPLLAHPWCSTTPFLANPWRPAAALFADAFRPGPAHNRRRLDAPPLLRQLCVLLLPHRRLGVRELHLPGRIDGPLPVRDQRASPGPPGGAVVLRWQLEQHGRGLRLDRRRLQLCVRRRRMPPRAPAFSSNCGGLLIFGGALPLSPPQASAHRASATPTATTSALSARSSGRRLITSSR